MTDFVQPVPVMPEFELRFTTQGHGAALATLEYADTPVTTPVLIAAGADPASAENVLYHFQQLLMGLRHDTEVDPGFDVLGVRERPVIMSTVLLSAIAVGPDAVQMIADMETCLAAAVFELTAVQPF